MAARGLLVRQVSRHLRAAISQRAASLQTALCCGRRLEGEGAAMNVADEIFAIFARARLSAYFGERGFHDRARLARPLTFAQAGRRAWANWCSRR